MRVGKLQALILGLLFVSTVINVGPAQQPAAFVVGIRAPISWTNSWDGLLIRPHENRTDWQSVLHRVAQVISARSLAY